MGEILQLRAYAVGGQVNHMAAKRSHEKELGWKWKGDRAELVPDDPKFDPKSHWAVLDGLDAVKWVYTFADYATDDVCDA